MQTTPIAHDSDELYCLIRRNIAKIKRIYFNKII